MSAHAQQAMIAFSITIGLIAFVFVAWFVCVAYTTLRDWLDERRVMRVRRIRNENLDASYRTGQFMVPKQFRDFK